MCVDYRKINAVTKEQKFPIPNLTDSIYSVKDVQYFTKIDLIKGYYQIPIEEESMKYTAFATHNQQYCFKRLPFGLKNSGLQFQRYINEILHDYISRSVLAYQDDILILSKSFDEHILLVEKVLNTLREHGIKIQAAKCEFFKKSVSYLGHIISIEGIRKSPKYIESIKNYPKPENVTQMRQFLGLANFQRKFAGNFSNIAKPLTSDTSGSKRKKIKWTEEKLQAFEKLKEVLAQDIQLSFPDYSEGVSMLEIYVDASETGMGAILVQKQQDELKTIAYASAAFTKTESRYSPIERELLAIKFGINSFKPFVFGVKFTVHSDHKPLRYLQNMHNDNSRLMRTALQLEEMDFIVKYHPGKENEAADALSRIFKKIEMNDDEKDNTGFLPKGLIVAQKIDGGGNSLFEAIMIAFEYVRDEIKTQIPNTHLELRKLAMQHLLDNPKKFNIANDKNNRKLYKSMMHDGILPKEEVMLSISDLYDVDIMVHHGMISPVLYQAKNTAEKFPEIHLQCINLIHFNPIINTLKTHRVKPEYTHRIVDDQDINEKEEFQDPVNMYIVQEKEQCECPHPKNSLICEIEGIKLCAIIDTGAQCSVITSSVVEKIQQANEQIASITEYKGCLKGIGKGKTEIMGVISLRLKMLEREFEIAPFAIVEDENMPCCAILGANFITKNNILIDFKDQEIYCMNETLEELVYPIDDYRLEERIGVEILTNVSLELNSVDLEENFDDSKMMFEYNIDKERFASMQDNNHAINLVKAKVSNKMGECQWKEPAIRQFKRFKKE